MPEFLVTFEGVEGCGKSIQARLLYEYLQSKGISSILTREPGGSDISERIRDILLDRRHLDMVPYTELFLYLASRAQHTQEVIKPALAQGKVVICDRYIDASVAYQGEGRGISKNLIKQLNKTATGGLLPNLTFLLDMDTEIALKRIEREDRLEMEGVEFHNRIRSGYLKLNRENPERIVLLNGMRSIKQIHNEIKDIFEARMMKLE
ncbi:dTMP kinase [candidate division WOR-3 bacterium JGI_Cruoil_03_44_89]|uniref:Thymidylate kinase n=1 Tax=candidate division WOR-3 bacterium JGI_Cruoil_03_44_89 TaxID=1973748 RepID=A0A235BPK3_UNCW3|nr:MAG: dTMP kinase [candidate division WOR-3 bacterium JGI_Cruoil_03_44_89]